jgi:hypothetical protein
MKISIRRFSRFSGLDVHTIQATCAQLNISTEPKRLLAADEIKKLFQRFGFDFSVFQGSPTTPNILVRPAKKTTFVLIPFNADNFSRLMRYDIPGAKLAEVFPIVEKKSFAENLNHQIDEAVGCLRESTNENNIRHQEEALLALAEVAMKSTLLLNEQKRKHPALFVKVIKKFCAWPIMASLYKGFRSTENEKRSLLKGLGSDVPWVLNQSAGWNPSLPYNRLAMVLVAYVHYCQGFFKDARQLLEFLPGEIEPELPRVALNLPELKTRSDAEEWWRYARKAFLLSYPEPDLDPELRILKKQKKSRNISAGSTAKFSGKIKAKSPSQVLSEMVDSRLRDAFLMVCGFPRKKKNKKVQ